MPKPMQVSLPALCLKYGGAQEFPNGWTGILFENNELPISVPPAADKEKLVYVRFPRHFIVSNGEGHPKKKTDAQKGMWMLPGLLRKAN